MRRISECLRAITIVGIVTLITLCTGGLGAASTQTASKGTPAASLDALRFLLGNWEADPDAAGVTGGFSFELKAQNHVMLRTNYSNSPASATRPASRHDDVMMVYVEGSAIRADYVDSEGHVIRYVAQPGTDRVSFVSEITPNEPRYRLSYVKTGDATLSGSFEIAPPGKPDGFGPYLTWTATRRPRLDRLPQTV
jgi:hypothetical protein